MSIEDSMTVRGRKPSQVFHQPDDFRYLLSTCGCDAHGLDMIFCFTSYTHVVPQPLVHLLLAFLIPELRYLWLYMFVISCFYSYSFSDSDRCFQILRCCLPLLWSAAFHYYRFKVPSFCPARDSCHLSTVPKLSSLVLNTPFFITVFDFSSEKSEDAPQETNAMELLKKISRNVLLNYASKEEVAFETLWQDRACVVTFLRRFGWSLCRLGAKELSDIKPLLDQHDVR